MSPVRRSVLRVPQASLAVGLVGLSEESSHYVTRVHRRGAGETVLLFDPGASVEGDAEIVAVQGKHVTCRIDALRPAQRCGIPGLHLVQGLGKGDKPDQVVRDGVVLGAQSIRFVVCERSVAQATDRDAKKTDRLQRIAIEAARQCGRGNLPNLQLGVAFASALPKAGDELSLVLHPGEDLPLLERAIETEMTRAVTVWVGPEGGFSDAELSDLRASGARLASLGDLVLRTELAAIVALARAGAALQSRG